MRRVEYILVELKQIYKCYGINIPQEEKNKQSKARWFGHTDRTGKNGLLTKYTEVRDKRQQTEGEKPRVRLLDRLDEYLKERGLILRLGWEMYGDEDEWREKTSENRLIDK